MSDHELEQIIRKRRQLRNLLLARERVKRLERELRGEPVEPEDAPCVPEFLRVQVDSRWADRVKFDGRAYTMREKRVQPERRHHPSAVASLRV